jgi:hypothetical protein
MTLTHRRDPAQYRLVRSHAKPDLARWLIVAAPAPDDPPDAAQSSPGRRVLEMLRGHWTIARRITPGRHFTGTASFTALAADSLLYRENGRLLLDNRTELDGENHYVYALRNGDIEISFADGLSKGKRFIAISLPVDHSKAFPFVSVDRHMCRLDTYEATFRMHDPDMFSMTYAVSGPKKDYISRSVYRRPERS